MICRVCDSTKLELAIDLGQQPWCNHFLKPEQVGKEPLYPLRVVWCTDCQTAQLDFTVPKETMFGDHTYLSGITRSLSEHFGRIASEVNQRFTQNKKTKSVLDIGSNDGTQLKYFQSLGFDCLGVESSKTTAKIAADHDIPTLNTFFNLNVAQSLNRKFDVINAAGVFFHLEELHSVTDGIRCALADDGVFVVQFLYMKRIVENLAFDQIYHEHLLYYNLETIQRLLARHGLEMFDAYLSPIHGGSIIGFVTHAGNRPQSSRLQEMIQAEQTGHCNELQTYLDFAERIAVMKEENLAFLQDARSAGKRVFGMGAPVKGNTLLNYFGIGSDLIECLVEKNQLRRGLYSPGMHLPIVIESELRENPDIYYVLAWNFKKEILANNQKLIEQGVEFFFPVDPVEVAV
ncbi:MAG TPA: class I SAM-dependent methyltransferase [Tepidisphaeraceae bacterium]